jgi:hypothetical protein
MPTNPETQAIQTVTAAYRSGLKLDGAWKPFAPSCPKVDVRPGDKVRCSFDGQQNVVAIEVVERGTGTLPASTISEGQKSFLSKLLDDREQTLQSLEEKFLVPFKGRRLDELSLVEAGFLLDFFVGKRKPQGPSPRGRFRH